MNTNIAKRSLEALEIFRKDGVKGFPWKPEVGGWILNHEDKWEIVTEINDNWLGVGRDWSYGWDFVKSWKNYYWKRYLPPERRLDQWIIDFNTKQDEIDIKHYEITHHILYKYISICIWNYRPDGNRNLSLTKINKFTYFNAEDQYLAKCQVIAKAFELTREE